MVFELSDAYWHGRRAVAWLHKNGAILKRAIDERDLANGAMGGVELGRLGFVEANHQLIIGVAFLNDYKGFLERVRGDTDAPALSQRVEMQATMVAHHGAIVRDDGARVLVDEGTQEVAHLDLANEANPLAVLLGSVWQVES